MRYEIELIDGTVLQSMYKEDVDWFESGVKFYSAGITKIIPWHRVKEIRWPERL